MLSFLSVLVIVGAMFFFSGTRAEGAPKTVYYVIAASLLALAALLSFIFKFEFTGPDNMFNF